MAAAAAGINIYHRDTEAQRLTGLQYSRVSLCVAYTSRVDLRSRTAFLVPVLPHQPESFTLSTQAFSDPGAPAMSSWNCTPMLSPQPAGAGPELRERLSEEVTPSIVRVS